MKKILFLVESMVCGGVEKSLLSLLNYFDYDKYGVDLQLMRKRGDFLALLPKQVNLLQEFEKEELYLPIFQSARLLLKEKKIKQFLYRIVKPLYYKTHISLFQHLSFLLLKTVNQKYDTIIVYDYTMLPLTLKKTKNSKYILYIHFDPAVWFQNCSDSEKKRNNDCLKKVDKIFCVSQDCKNSFVKVFPEQKEKVAIVKNIIDINQVRKQAMQPINRNSKDAPLIITVGRLSYQKGIDLAIEAADILKRKGIKFSWVCVGDGELQEELENQIRKYHLEDEFQLAGAKLNPYSYIAKADLYVQPSRFESYGLTVAEALLLRRPVIASDLTCLHELAQGNDAILFSKCSAQSFADNIERLLNDNARRHQMIQKSKLFDKNLQGNLEALYREL